MSSLTIRILLIATIIQVLPLQAQRGQGTKGTISGGKLSYEQASYDVRYYDLDLVIDPDEQSIAGSLALRADIKSPLKQLVLDLDYPLTVSAVTGGIGDDELTLTFERREDQIWIDLPREAAAGESINATVTYSGKPRVAPNPPWVGGFVWSKTESGEHWIGVACENDGPDLWWPVKDHIGDEPDSMAISITVPSPLFVASNGILRKTVENSDGTRTFHWFVNSPINNYNVTVNIGPYVRIDSTFTSITGETFPVYFWVLPEDEEKGRILFPQFIEHLEFFEAMLEPYHTRNQKYGVAHTPYLGMEHQTIIAYGANFENNDMGYDGLHFHELAHEWWGNLITASTWNHMWIHEGFASYMGALYAEFLHGEESYHEVMAGMRSGIRNVKAFAPREEQNSRQVYFMPPDYEISDGDIYSKGALLLHTLRYLVGDKTFFLALRRMAYLTPELELVNDGSQFRHVTTDDFQELVERLSGRKLGWFFDVYAREAALPILKVTRRWGKLKLAWKGPNKLPFPMPVDVTIDGVNMRIMMDGKPAKIKVKRRQKVTVDPLNWILKE